MIEEIWTSIPLNQRRLLKSKDDPRELVDQFMTKEVRARKGLRPTLASCRDVLLHAAQLSRAGFLSLEGDLIEGSDNANPEKYLIIASENNMFFSPVYKQRDGDSVVHDPDTDTYTVTTLRARKGLRTLKVQHKQAYQDRMRAKQKLLDRKVVAKERRQALLKARDEKTLDFESLSSAVTGIAATGKETMESLLDILRELGGQLFTESGISDKAVEFTIDTALFLRAVFRARDYEDIATAFYHFVGYNNTKDLLDKCSGLLSKLSGIFKDQITRRTERMDILSAAIPLDLEMKDIGNIQHKKEECPDEDIRNPVFESEFSLPSVKDMYTTVLQSEMVITLRELILTAASARFFEKDTASKLYAFFGKPPAMSISKAIEYVLEKLEILFRIGQDIYNGTPISIAMLGRNPVALCSDRVDKLIAKSPYLYSGLPVPNKTSRVEFWRESQELLRDCEFLLKDSPYNNNVAALKEKVCRLGKILEVIDNERRGSDRITPLLILLCGPPGIGKSLLISFLCQVQAGVMGREFHPSMIYPKDAGPYWEGHKPLEQPYIFFSEMGNLSDNLAKKAGDERVMMLCSLADNNRYTFDMAFEEKGKVWACPEMLIADTNNPDLNLDYCVSNPAAVRRRILYILPEVKSQFRKDNSCSIDKDKSVAYNQEHPEDNILDRWTFKVWVEEPISAKRSVKRYLLNGEPTDDIYMLTEFLKDYMLSYYQHQERIQKGDMQAKAVDAIFTRCDLHVRKSHMAGILAGVAEGKVEPNSVPQYVKRAIASSLNSFKVNGRLAAHFVANKGLSSMVSAWNKVHNVLLGTMEVPANRIDDIIQDVQDCKDEDEVDYVIDHNCYNVPDDGAYLKMRYEADWMDRDYADDLEAMRLAEQDLAILDTEDDLDEYYDPEEWEDWVEYKQLTDEEMGLPKVAEKHISDEALDLIVMQKRERENVDKQLREAELRDQPVNTDDLPENHIDCKDHDDSKESLSKLAGEYGICPDSVERRINRRRTSSDMILGSHQNLLLTAVRDGSRSGVNALAQFLHAREITHRDMIIYYVTLLWYYLSVIFSFLHGIIKDVSNIMILGLATKGLTLKAYFYIVFSVLFILGLLPLRLGLSLFLFVDLIPQAFFRSTKELTQSNIRGAVSRTLKKRWDVFVDGMLRRERVYFKALKENKALAISGLFAAVMAIIYYSRKKSKPVEELIKLQSRYHNEYVENDLGNNKHLELASQDERLVALEAAVGAAKGIQVIPTYQDQTQYNTAVTVAKPTAHRGDMESLMASISRNIVEVRIQDADGLQSKTHMLGVKSDYWVINTHALTRGVQRLWFRKNGLLDEDFSDNTHNEYIELTPEMRADLGSDVSVIKVPGFNKRNILMHITNSKVTPFAARPGIFLNTRMTVSKVDKRVVLGKGNEVTALDEVFCYYYAGHCKGMCGIPLIVEMSNPQIAGIHTGASDDEKVCLATILDRSAIENGISMIQTSTGLIDPPSLGDIKQPLKMPGPKSTFSHIPLSRVEFHGTQEGVVLVNQKSKVEKSPFHYEAEQWFEKYPDSKEEFAPPIMKPGNYGGKYISPYNLAYTKMNKQRKQIDHRVLSKIVNDCVTRFVLMLDEADIKRLTPLTMDQAINGVENNPFIGPINLSTSGGEGFPGKKRDYFTVDDKGRRYPTREVVSSVVDILKCYSEGESASRIYVGQLKDEPRSAEKVKSGKTRVFFMSPLDLLIAHRMFLSPFYSLLVSHKHIFGTLLGTDMWKHGDAVRTKLLKFKNWFEGDYSNYDQGMPYGVGAAAASIVAKVCKALGYNESAMKIVETMAGDNLFPLVSILKDLSSVVALQPSGKYATAEDNSLRGLVMVLYFWYTHPKLSTYDFWSETVVFIYGDDILMSVSDVCGKYLNQVTYAQYCESVLGLGFTSSTKKGVSEMFTPIVDCSILKRKFIYKADVDNYVAALNLASIRRSLMWYLRSGSVTVAEQFTGTLRSAARELFHHLNREEYCEFRDLFTQLFNDKFPGYLCDIPTYDELIAAYMLNRGQEESFRMGEDTLADDQF